MNKRMAGIVCAGWMAAAAASEEVPFVTTPDAVTKVMLELAAVGPADHLIDLGSGDGRIVITAAKRHGASGLGVEIVPALVAESRENARRAGVADRVAFEAQDLFTTDLSRATVITMYLLPDVNLQLRPRLLALAPGTRIVSHDWDLGDWTPERTVTVDRPDKVLGRDKHSRVHLWTVPARVHGLWCGDGGTSLQIEQRFDRFSAAWQRPGAAAPALVFDGQIHGGTRLAASGLSAVVLRWSAGALLGEAGPPGWPGQRFTPTDGSRCR